MNTVKRTKQIITWVIAVIVVLILLSPFSWKTPEVILIFALFITREVLYYTGKRKCLKKL